MQGQTYREAAERWNNYGRDLAHVGPFMKQNMERFWCCLAVSRKLEAALKYAEPGSKEGMLMPQYDSHEALEAELFHIRYALQHDSSFVRRLFKTSAVKRN